MVFDAEKVIVEEIKENAEESDTSVEEKHAGKKKPRKYYICLAENCTAAFSRRYKLQCHERTHTGERPFICLYDECFKSYARPAHLKRHVQKVHESKDEVLLTCSFPKCEKKFKSQIRLDKHIKNIHEKRKYVCKTCLKPFLKHQHLKSHEYEHTGIKPFQCSGCDKSFVLPSRLKRHMKVHAGYKCDAFGCNAIFTTWTFLLQHKKAFHSTTYLCDICKKTFNTRYNLQLHIKIHEEERETYHCPHPSCPRYYLHERNLLLHIKSYHEEREFHCTINGCSARFAHKVSLKKHLERHSNQVTFTKSKKMKSSKSSKGKKPKRRRKRKPSMDEEDMAAFLSSYNKNSVENIAEESCLHRDQHDMNDVGKENDSHL